MSHPHRPQPGPLGEPQQDNDPLTAHAAAAGQWGLPSEGVGVLDVPAHLPGEGFDYSNGLLVGHPNPDEANEQGFPTSPHLIRVRSDVPRGFDTLAHESTHRRFEPPLIRSISQAAAGFSLIAAPNQGLHYVKVIALFLTLDAAGTVKFVQGSIDGTSTADLTGAMNLGGAATPPMQLSPSGTENPWLYTSPDQALGLFTVTGKAQGWAMVVYSPYDS